MLLQSLQPQQKRQQGSTEHSEGGDLIELAASCNLQGSGGGWVLQVDQLCHHTLHPAPVKPPLRITVLEIDTCTITALASWELEHTHATDFEQNQQVTCLSVQEDANGVLGSYSDRFPGNAIKVMTLAAHMAKQVSRNRLFGT